MMAHVSGDPEALEVFERQIPLRRSGEEDDAKGVAVFLASEASRVVTGITLIVDGGTICHGNPALGKAWPGTWDAVPKQVPPPGKDYSTVGYGLFDPFVLNQATLE